MADSKLIAKIGEELECAVCADYFTDACFLSCMHTFCRQCLDKCQKTHGRGGKCTMECPMCRQVTHLGRAGVGGLRTNYTSNKLVTKLKEGLKERADRSSKKQAMSCQSCEDGVVVSYCLSCRHFICASCHSIHSKIIAMKTHELIPLNDLRKGNVKVVRMENSQFCSFHSQSTTCFCYACQKYQCELCCMIDHNREGHSCTEPSHNGDSSSIAESKKNMLKESVERLTRKRGSIDEQKGEIKLIRSKVKHHYRVMKDELKSHHDLKLRTITRAMNEKHDDLVNVISDDEQLVLIKIASVEASLGHAESRTLEAKSIGDNALKDGQHAEIAVVTDYLETVISSLEEDKSADRILGQIKQYSDKVRLNHTSAQNDVESLSSLGDVFRPRVWEETEVSGMLFDNEFPRALCYNAADDSFLICSRTSISNVSRNGQVKHEFTFETGLCVRDMAVGSDGKTSHVLFDDNRIRVFGHQSWEKYTGVIEVPQKNRDTSLSALATSDQGMVVVGDQATHTIIGCSSTTFKKMTDVSPIKMTFTSSGELAVVSRNIRQVDSRDTGRWNEAGVSVKVFGVRERKENFIIQNNWQAAAVASRNGSDDDGCFFALGVYVLEDGRQLASLAEYDSFGTRHGVIFIDKELEVNLESGMPPLLAVDKEGDTIAVFTGADLRLFQRRDFSEI